MCATIKPDTKLDGDALSAHECLIIFGRIESVEMACRRWHPPPSTAWIKEIVVRKSREIKLNLIEHRKYDALAMTQLSNLELTVADEKANKKRRLQQ